MPTYEYTCRDCGHTFDIVQSMWDESLTMCPECGGSLRKVFAPPAISFKGSGFYATDHGKKSKSSAESRSDGEKKSGESKEGATKSEGAASSDGSKDTSSKGSSGGSEKSSAPAKKEPAPS
ncbi:MAG: FmdB family zinc ribbon protein [Actinomycetota bacterium]